MKLVNVFVMVLYLFVCFQKTSRQSYPAQRKRKMKSLPSPKTREQARLSPLCCRSRNYRVDICDRNTCTSSIAGNEHIQTVMGQQKMQNFPALAQCRTNVMGQRWADEQTLGWPIQYLQPWANRAASDGPMEGQCIRAIWGWGIMINE